MAETADKSADNEQTVSDEELELKINRLTNLEGELELKIQEAGLLFAAALEKSVKSFDASALDNALNYLDNLLELLGVKLNDTAGTAAEADAIIKMHKTKSPNKWITPVDKVSKTAFDGKGILYQNSKYVHIATSGYKTKKELEALVSLNYDDKSIQISGQKELTPYDREVHDALVTLYIDGGNDHITPQMIYRAMTGNAKAKLNARQKEAIGNSLNKLMFSRLVIKASEEECKAYKFKEFSYQGNVIQGEKIKAVTDNGEVVEVYHLLREPALYSYASKKSQIGRLNIKLLNSPVNKNEENIILQSYLYRRILAMKGSHGKLSRTIVYNTVFKELDLHAASQSALRNKKAKVRNTIKTILDYWKEQKFICGYAENNRKLEIISVTIQL